MEKRYPTGTSIQNQSSVPPASTTSTRLFPSFVSRFASTHPALPAPTTM